MLLNNHTTQLYLKIVLPEIDLVQVGVAPNIYPAGSTVVHTWINISQEWSVADAYEYVIAVLYEHSIRSKYKYAL